MSLGKSRNRNVFLERDPSACSRIPWVGIVDAIGRVGEELRNVVVCCGEKED